jgi:hypothetical protein
MDRLLLGAARLALDTLILATRSWAELLVLLTLRYCVEARSGGLGALLEAWRADLSARTRGEQHDQGGAGDGSMAQLFHGNLRADASNYSTTSPANPEPSVGQPGWWWFTAPMTVAPECRGDLIWTAGKTAPLRYIIHHG